MCGVLVVDGRRKQPCWKIVVFAAKVAEVCKINGCVHPPVERCTLHGRTNGAGCLSGPYRLSRATAVTFHELAMHWFDYLFPRDFHFVCAGKPVYAREAPAECTWPRQSGRADRLTGSHRRRIRNRRARLRQNHYRDSYAQQYCS